MDTLELVSHILCPYVQRVAIALDEKGIPFKRTYIDLADKPAWFRELSPMGKVPLLRTQHGALFESAVILEYLEDALPHPLHPQEPYARARHRAWMEFGSGVLNDIAGLYSAASETAFHEKCRILRGKFERIEQELRHGPYFAGEGFSLVDAVYGPIFRYWNVFDEIGDFGILTDLPKLAAWRTALARRASVCHAVLPSYAEALRKFLKARESYLSMQMA